MRVAMVTQGSFPPDVRIEKEAQILTKAGHSILVFTPEARMPDTGDIEVIHHRFRGFPSTNFFKLRNLFKRSGVEIVHLQDTPGASEALFAAKSLGLKVIYDMHEIWPSLVIENSENLTFATMLWSASMRAEQAIAFMGSNVSLTVVDEATDYLTRKYRRSTRVYSIQNFETLERFKNIRASTQFVDEQDFMVTYVGSLDGPIRGIQDMILAATLLSKEKIQFLTVGSGQYMGWLQMLTRRLHLEKKVRLLGSRTFSEAMGVVAASDLCLVPHKVCNSTQYTLPHKISQYMALQKPVIAPNLKPISRLFSSAFIKWEPRTPMKLAELIISIRDDKVRRDEIAQQGYKLVSEKYKWEDEGKKLLAIYERLSHK